MAQPGKPDPKLVQKAVRGDRKAFRELFNRYFQAVYNFALTLACDPALAEDITQEAFIRAHTNIHRLGPPWNFRAWIFRLARNYFIDQTRKEKDLVPLEEEAQVISPAPGPEREKISEDTADRVHGTLDTLSLRQREILVLRELQGFSYAEIGEIMELSSSNVKVSLHRARGAFQEAYGIQLLLDDPSGECQEVAALLPILHDQEGQLDKAHFVREHLKVCEACRKRRDQLIKQSALLGAFIPVLPPEGLAERILEKLPAPKGGAVSSQKLPVQRILGISSLTVVFGVTLWLAANMVFNTDKYLPNFPGKSGTESTPAVEMDDAAGAPTATPQSMDSYSGPVEPDARCFVFDDLVITSVFLNIREDTYHLPMYFKFEGGVPGLSLDDQGESDSWEYIAHLGGISSGICSLQGYPDRLYCIIPILETMAGSYQELSLQLVGCEDAVYFASRVSVPGLNLQEGQSLVCKRDLPSTLCEAAGGIYRDLRSMPSFCECP